MTRSLRLLSLALLLAGCPSTPATVDADVDGGRDAGPPRPDVGPIDAGTDAFVPYDAGPFTRVTETVASAGRTGCGFARGAMPWETVGEEFPIGEDIPIRHFIILMQENRSFDHYFGAMPGVEGLDGAQPNPHADGTPVDAFHTDEYCVADPHHSWSGAHHQWNDGANDGFVTGNDDTTRGMGYLTEEDLPFYYDLAQTFAMSDHHHCALLGPTQPNREYLYAASSLGMITNDIPPATRFPATGDYVIQQQLDRIGVSWHIYYSSVPWAWLPFGRWFLQAPQRSRTTALDTFFTDLEAGNLADVVWIDPTWTASGTEMSDEHPPANPQFGQAWIRNIITHVMDSPLWEDTAIVFTYDEHGGFYDHVPPPEACPPGDFEPDLAGGDPPGAFDRYGFRVPLVVVSPYARAGYVSDHVTDHASVVRLLQARYLLPALTGRDANAWPLLDMFDFETTNPATSSELAAAPIDEAHRTACEATGL
jgi:phospholipase C